MNIPTPAPANANRIRSSHLNDQKTPLIARKTRPIRPVPPTPPNPNLRIPINGTSGYGVVSPFKRRARAAPRVNPATSYGCVFSFAVNHTPHLRAR